MNYATRAVALLATLYVMPGCGHAAPAATLPAAPAPGEVTSPRPAIGFYRWQEDWSALAEPNSRTGAGDGLKYLPISGVDPARYLSVGVTLRERFESNDAAPFGNRGAARESYLLHRLELHLDAHLSDRVRLFVQLENALAPGRAHAGPADANQADLRLAFLDSDGRLWGGAYQVRVGRQEIAFDLQRFVSVRDGPNLRQAYNAIWANYERGVWRLSGFYSQPVQYRNDAPFDDFGSHRLSYGGVRLHRRLPGHTELSLTFSQYRHDDAHFPAGSGRERRHQWNVRYVGAVSGFDWDIETMSQQGRLGAKSVHAWAAGSLAGYTFSTTPWQPRVGLQLDAASGDRDLADRRVGTFNPLFPNGAYLTLAGYTGYTNFIHLKPTLTLVPAEGIKVWAAIGELWRQTTGDAVYAQPRLPFPIRPANRAAALAATASCEWTGVSAAVSPRRWKPFTSMSPRPSAVPVVTMWTIWVPRSAGGGEMTRRTSNPTSGDTTMRHAASREQFGLSFVAGYADTLSFIAMSGLFTAHVTGNMVLAAAHVSGQGGREAISNLVMIPVFMLAVALVALLARCSPCTSRTAAQRVRLFLALELILLAAFWWAGVTMSIDPGISADIPG